MSPAPAQVPAQAPVQASALPGALAPALSLHDAMTRAEQHAFANRMADANTREQAADATRALQGILPTVHFEAGYVRTTDPIGAFGTTLRQRRIQQQDFDPARLNHPAPITNMSGAVVVQQPLLNADAHLGRRAASRATAAARAGAEWTRTQTRVAVVHAYYGAVLAAEKALMLEAAHRAAEAHVAQARRVVREGLATRSDELLASVRAGEVEAQLVEARAEEHLALRQLALVLGTPEDTLRVVETLPSAAQVRRLFDAHAGERLNVRGEARDNVRADVLQARLGVQAARLDVQRARSLLPPRLNAFARYDWNSADTPFAGDENWSVGVMATWTPFASASQWAERQGAGARAVAAQAGEAAMLAQASLEVEAALSRREVAHLRLAIAERAVEQSREAHRIVARKYEGGLSSIAELLDAAALETQSDLALAHALYTGITAEAELRRALGQDPAEMAALLDDTTHEGANE